MEDGRYGSVECRWRRGAGGKLVYGVMYSHSHSRRSRESRVVSSEEDAALGCVEILLLPAGMTTPVVQA